MLYFTRGIYQLQFTNKNIIKIKKYDVFSTKS